MTPTNYLRFVERTVKRDVMDGDRIVIKDSVVTVRILQQKVQTSHIKNINGEYLQYYLDEWRDVPLEQE
jgi:hypothetical protein